MSDIFIANIAEIVYLTRVETDANKLMNAIWLFKFLFNANYTILFYIARGGYFPKKN